MTHKELERFEVIKEAHEKRLKMAVTMLKMLIDDTAFVRGEKKRSLVILKLDR